MYSILYYRTIPATIAHEVAQAYFSTYSNREEVSPNDETELYDDYV